MKCNCEMYLRAWYESERKQSERNYSHGHSYEEWRDHVLAGGR